MTKDWAARASVYEQHKAERKNISSLTSVTIVKKYFRYIYIRLCKPRSYWHNRKFHPSLNITHETPESYSIFWKGNCIAEAAAASTVNEQQGVCNIIASGPSINEIKNPTLLFNNKTICVNGSFIVARDLGAKPDYYMIGDRGFIRRKFELFKSAALGSKAIALDAYGINTVCEIDPLLLKSLPLIYLEDCKHPFMRCNLERPEDRRQKKFDASLINHDTYDIAFSKDLSLGIFSTGTVVYSAVQFAYGIGFKELRIFGMDLHSSGRFYSEDPPEPLSLHTSYESRIEPGFELVKQYATEESLTIYNCCPHSRLPDTIIPKIDPNMILEQDRLLLSSPS